MDHGLDIYCYKNVMILINPIMLQLPDNELGHCFSFNCLITLNLSMIVVEHSPKLQEYYW